MGMCSNFECIGHTWGDKIRCSKCRHSKDYTCASCGVELSGSRAIRCKDCAYINKTDIVMRFQRIRLMTIEGREHKNIIQNQWYHENKDRINKNIRERRDAKKLSVA